MIVLKWLLLLVFILPVSSCSWFRNDSPSLHSNESVNALVANSDDHVFITGSIYGTNSSESVLATCMKGNGDLIWKTRVSTERQSGGRAIQLCADGGLLILSYPWDIPSDQYIDVCLAKLNGAGQQQWSRTIPTHFKDYVSCSACPNGGFTLTGSGKHYPASSLVLLKMDQEGNTIFERTYGDSLFGIAASGADDKSLCCVHTNHGSFYAMYVDTQGDSLSSLPLGDGIYSLSAVEYRPDGKFNLIGSNKYNGNPLLVFLNPSTQSVNATDYLYSDLLHAYATATNANGDMVMPCAQPSGSELAPGPYKIVGMIHGGSWAIDCTNPSIGNAPVACASGDSCFFVAGSKIAPDADTYHTDAYVVKVNLTGTLLWERTFGID